jgi:hypothetical protein
MCNPTLIMAAGSQIMGASMQQNATQSAESAKALALNENTARNTALESEARGGIDQSVAGMERQNFDQGVSNIGQSLANLYSETIGAAPAPSMSPSSGNAPRVIQDVMSAAMNAQADKDAARNLQLADLNSVSDYLGNTISPLMASSGAGVSQNAGFMRGNSVPLDAELLAANKKAYSPVAQILTGAGQTAAGYGLKK